ncbi:MAG: protein kinase domain-containing protein [Alphaproteobacteria bacterium]
MQSSTLKPHKRLLSGVTALALLVTTLAPTASAHAMRKPIAEEKQPSGSRRTIQIKQPIVPGESKGEEFELYLNMTTPLAEKITQETGLDIQISPGAQKIANYTIGAGYFGKLHFARDKEKQFVGVKFIQNDANKLDAIQLGLKEADIQLKLAGSPYIMPLLDYHDYKYAANNYRNDVFMTDTLMLFMPLDTFGNGAFFQKQLALLTDAATKKKLMEHVAISVLKGLTFMHEKGFAHLDLHPANITMDRRTGAVHLIDFGCSKPIVDSKVVLEKDAYNMEDAIGHTKVYFTPERLAKRRFEEEKRGADVGDAEVLPKLFPSTDHYAMAISLYEMCFNRYPIPENTPYANKLTTWDYDFFEALRGGLSGLKNRNNNGQDIQAFLWDFFEPNYKKRLKPQDALKRYENFQELSGDEGAVAFNFLLGKLPLPQPASAPEVKVENYVNKGQYVKETDSPAAADFANNKASPGQKKGDQTPEKEVRPTWLKTQDDAVFQRFLKGVLVYRPTEGSDVGKIELRVADLANPLEGIFDLSKCGDAGKYLSIATEYRKGKIEANENKLEIWLAPRFLIEKNLSGDAKHFQPIMGNWDGQKAPVGLFFTYGGWNGSDHMQYYDYLTTQSMDELSDGENYYGKWERTSHTHFAPFSVPISLHTHLAQIKIFMYF